MSDDAGQQTSLDEIVNGYNEDEEDGVDYSAPDIAGKVPEDWEIVTVEDLSTNLLGGGTPSKSNDAYWGGEIPWASVKDLDGITLSETEDYITQEGLDNSASNLIPPHSIVISTRMTVGEPFVNQTEMAINQDMKGIIPNNNIVNTYYFVYNLRKKDAYLKSLGRGTTVDGISTLDLERVHIELPPLTEQRKIASVIYNADKAIQKTEEIIQQTERLHTGLRRELVIEGIDHNEFQEMRVGPFTFEIPASWEIVPVDEACENLDKDRIPVKQAKREEMQGDIPYYGASGIIDYVDDYLFDDNLILLAEDGENLLSRNSPISFKISGKAWVNNHAHVLKPREEFDIDYLVEYFERLSYEPFVTGSAQPKLTQSSMEMLSVPKPPEKEQARISSILTTVSEHKNECEQYKEKLQELKKGLMQDLLAEGVRTNDKNIEVLPEVKNHG